MTVERRRRPELRVGFVGLGKMGSQMARNLVKSGYRLTVWNRTREKAAELEAAGAMRAESPKELAAMSDMVICMLSSPSVTESVVLGHGEYAGSGLIDGCCEGSIIIDMSTNHPLVIKKMAELLRHKGATLIEAPVIGSVGAAAEARLTILIGGDKEAAEAVKPVLGAMGDKMWYIGREGTATTLKLILNLQLWFMVASFSECLMVGTKMGIDPETLLRVWNSTVLKTYVSEHRSSKVLQRDWSPTATLETAIKDLSLVCDVARSSGVPLPLASLARELFIAASSIGLKDLDYMSLILLYEKLCGLETGGDASKL